MNVNLWGPELWSILHGIAPLSKIPAPIELFSELATILPCIHCKKSYCEFFDKNEAQEGLKSAPIEYVYKIHCLVDDKLDKQRIEKLFEAVQIPDDLKEKIRQSSLLLSNRPTIQVVKKRWELSEHKPFCETSVWKVLFAFVMVLDTEEDAEDRRKSLKWWIESLSKFLLQTHEYSDLGSSLSLLAKCLPHYSFTTRQGFTLIALAKERLLHDREYSRDEIHTLKMKEGSWLKPLWHAYKHNMPAGSCGKFTCA